MFSPPPTSTYSTEEATKSMSESALEAMRKAIRERDEARRNADRIREQLVSSTSILPAPPQVMATFMGTPGREELREADEREMAAFEKYQEARDHWFDLGNTQQ